jgi:hypothetical protein
MCYDYFMSQFADIFRRNVQDDFPHYNSFYFVRKAYPKYAKLLTDTAADMILSGYDEPFVDAFIRAYKLPCKEVREHHIRILQERGPTVRRQPPAISTAPVREEKHAEQIAFIEQPPQGGSRRVSRRQAVNCSRSSRP